MGGNPYAISVLDPAAPIAHHGGMSSEFPDTRWSLIARVRSDDPAESSEALAEICRDYWMPLYQFLRIQGDSKEQAEDVVQGFFEKVIEKGWLERIEPMVAAQAGGAEASGRGGGEEGTTPPVIDEGEGGSRVRLGRLRSYLLACLKAYRAKVYRAGQAAKRGGGLTMVSTDLEGAESAIRSLAETGLGPEEQFDRAWALALVRAATERLRARYESKGRGDLFDALEPCLASAEPPRYEQIGVRLGVGEGKLRTDLHRLRKRLRDQIREEVARTIDPRSGVGIEEELSNIAKALG